MKAGNYWKVFFVFSFFPLKTETNIDQECDKHKIMEMVKNLDFKPSVVHDPRIVTLGNFIRLSKEDNRKLWFDEIQFPRATGYTEHWNDYAEANYRASNLDFIDFFKGSKKRVLAFQLGPNWDLWAYHIFVFYEMNGCYVGVRSYFRHARFTYKAYAVLNANQFDSLSTVVSVLPKKDITPMSGLGYKAFFYDGVNQEDFYVDVLSERDSVPVDTIVQNTSIGKTDSTVVYDLKYRKPVSNFFDFIDKRIDWMEVY